MMRFQILPLLVLGWGCSTKNAPLPTNSETPSDVLNKLYRAGVDGNKTVYLDCFTGKEATQEGLAAGFDFMQEVYRLRAAVIAAYGLPAWDQIQENKSCRFIILDPLKNPFQDIPIIIQGDTAAFTWQLRSDEPPKTAKMIYINGRWLIKGHSIVAGMDESDENDVAAIRSITTLMRKLATRISVIREEVSKPGTDVNILCDKLGEMFKESMLEALGAQPL